MARTREPRLSSPPGGLPSTLVGAKAAHQREDGSQARKRARREAHEGEATSLPPLAMGGGAGDEGAAQGAHDKPARKSNFAGDIHLPNLPPIGKPSNSRPQAPNARNGGAGGNLAWKKAPNALDGSYGTLKHQQL